jgi:hypothetical protein
MCQESNWSAKSPIQSSWAGRVIAKPFRCDEVSLALALLQKETAVFSG